MIVETPSRYSPKMGGQTGIPEGVEVSGIPVIGGVDTLLRVSEPLSVVCAIGAPSTRRKIIQSIRGNSNLRFPALVDPSVKSSDSVRLGKGCIICADSILTVTCFSHPWAEN